MYTTCERCGKEGLLAPFPFRYMQASDPRADADGYTQPFGCKECLDWERRLAIAKRMRYYGFSKNNLKPLTPWFKFSHYAGVKEDYYGVRRHS